MDKLCLLLDQKIMEQSMSKVKAAAHSITGVYCASVDFLRKIILLRSCVEFSRVVGMIFRFLDCRNDI